MHRVVPESRIKTLSGSGMVPTNNKELSHEDWDFVCRRMASIFAEELIAKLREFGKFKIMEISPGMIHYSVSLDIIVPETPR